MKAHPSFQFYPADWLRDPGLRSCSLAARGLWIDMLAFMHEAEPYGHLRLNGKDIGAVGLARMVGSAQKPTESLLHELEGAGVFSRTEEGTIFSRRMVRDQELREKRGQYGHLSQAHPMVPRKKSEKDTEKDTIKDTLPTSIEGSIRGSPSSSSSSSSSKEKKEKTPTAVDLEFEEFWQYYPMRDGRRLDKPEALRKWQVIKVDDRKQVLIAVRHYANSKQVLEGIGIKDPHRWLRKGKKDEPWREWLEPAHAHTNGHGSQTCTKRIQGPGDRFLRPCGQLVSPQSGLTEPQCTEHVAVATQKEAHATH